MALWGGRFDPAVPGPDARFRAFNDSLAFDKRLLEQDIEGSIAWAGALHGAGVLSEEERARLEESLRAVLVEVRANPALIDRAADEDVHSFVERLLVERVGPLGKKLHTGRSRNDQVATDMRLWTRARIDETRAALAGARRSLLALARRELGTVFPGYTHLQRAQPLLLAHWALAYDEMLARDDERFADARRRVNRCPLGSGALAGTSYPIDRDALARALAFDGPTLNSLDAVSDRDFVLETLSACAITAIHLSRLAEDLVLYASGEFALVEMSDQVSTGSSLMPQKKNPDALELIRGKAGRIIGAFAALAVTLKGLPLAYNKDMQEDKEPLFDASDQLLACLGVLPMVLDGLIVNRGASASAAAGGYSNATELADYLVSKGVPFREAHEVTGRIVRHAISIGRPLDGVPMVDLRRFSPAIGDDVAACLGTASALAKRACLGGTAPGRVAEAVSAAEHRLGS